MSFDAIPEKLPRYPIPVVHLGRLAVDEAAKGNRILTVDDHPLVCEGIATLIKTQPDKMLIAEANSGRESREKFREHQPDVTLLDFIFLHALSAHSTTQTLLRQCQAICL